MSDPALIELPWDDDALSLPTLDGSEPVTVRWSLSSILAFEQAYGSILYITTHLTLTHALGFLRCFVAPEAPATNEAAFALYRRLGHAVVMRAMDVVNKRMLEAGGFRPVVSVDTEATEDADADPPA